MKCVSLIGDKIDVLSSNISQCKDMIIMSNTDYHMLVNDSLSRLCDLLTFDPKVCASISGACLLFFVTSYGLGSVLRFMGRS